MSTQDTVFYQDNQAFLVNFSGENISSEGGVILLEKLERKHHIIKNLSRSITDNRNSAYITHTVDKILKQRVFMNLLGYEDANDADKLKDDKMFSKVFKSSIASQATISRFENNVDKHQIYNILEYWIDAYVAKLGNRKTVTIDADATDAETFGHQQYTLYNGFYGHFMYNELFFHDGDTGEIILPVLRPGNAHSNWWYVSILKRIIQKIKEKYPEIEIIIRADSGFSTPKFYALAKTYDLKYTIAIAANEVLKKRTENLRKFVKHFFVNKNRKRQIFIAGFNYQAGTWDEAQTCYAKVESTGKGLNVRYFISNFEKKTGKEIYRDFYVKRADRSENRIKEVKTMCFADRMSNHSFWGNFFRLLISSLSYEFMRLIKEAIKKTGHKKAKQWQVNNIRLFLLKIGGILKETKRRIIIKLSKTAIYKDLYLKIIFQN